MVSQPHSIYTVAIMRITLSILFPLNNKHGFQVVMVRKLTMVITLIP